MCWIKIHDKLLDWEWSSSPEMMALWIHLLLRANKESRKWKGMEIGRGQVVTSLSNLSEMVGLSIQKTRTCLDRLKSTNEITIKSTNKYTIITVCKYDSYQVNEKGFQQAEQQALQQSNNKQITTTKELKNLEKKENISKDILKKENVVDEIAERLDKVVCKNEPIDFSYMHPDLVDDFREFLEVKNVKLTRNRTVKTYYNRLLELSQGDMDKAKELLKAALDNGWQDFYLKRVEKPKAKNNDNYSNDNYWK